MRRKILLLVLMFLPIMANAYDAEINGIYYNFSGSKAIVTYRDSQYRSYSGSVTIPESVSYNGKTYNVTGISGSAFAYCYDLSSISIPNSVTSIGERAFNCCSSLLLAIIPSSVTEIGERAFEGCESLTTAAIPDGVKTISNRTFFGCTNLTSLTIGNGVTSIGMSAFAGCRLTSLVFPNSVTSIGAFAFANCSDITSVTFPNSLKSIGSQAFEGCAKLTSLTIPNSVNSIAYDAFFGCNGLTSFVIDKGNTMYDSRDNCNAIIETGSNTLIWGCSNTIIPNSVTSIGNYGFQVCEGLTSVNIPEGVTSIGEGAFDRCSNLKIVSIPRSVTYIGSCTFAGCFNLTDFYCYAENVPKTEYDLFGDVPTSFFYHERPHESATLHVPAVSIEKYKATEPWSGFGNIVATASDVQSSGCLNNTRAGSNSTKESISLLKEGNILTVNLHNYWSQCATEDFEVTPSVSESNNGDPYTVSVKVKSIGENEADCICPYNISFTIHGVEADSFYFDCWWFKGQVNLTEGEQLVLSNEYYPEGTKWTEIRLDTLKYDSWYSKVGDEWVPNYETIEYYVKGEHENKYWESPFKCVYTNGPEWTDSLALLIYEGKVYGYDMGILATVPVPVDDDLIPWPGEAYYFDWRVGMTVEFKDITSSNTTAIYPPGTFDFGQIEEIKEGDFGGVRPLKYTDINGVRIIQGIGVTTWNDGECLFGPVETYNALRLFGFLNPYLDNRKEYRSMLVHFERNGEVLYDAWPTKEIVSYTKGQMATIILPTEPDANKGKYYRLDRCEDGKIIFTEELQPKAKVPYIIVPNEDFNIDLNTLDLEGLTKSSVSVGGVSFIGSYNHAEFNCEEGYYIDIIDKTTDCHVDDANLKMVTIGALRAYLKVSWDDPYRQGGTRGIKDKLEIILHDDETGIAEMKNNRAKSERYNDGIYDLQGRRLLSKPAKGLYMQNGKKFMVK